MYPTRIQRIKDIPENVFKKHEELVGVLRHGLSQEGEISDGSIYSKRYWNPASAQESLIEKFWRQRFSYKMLEASALHKTAAVGLLF